MKKQISQSLVWAGGVIGLALVATALRQNGWIDAEMVNRIVMGSIGLMVAWYGNRLPKVFAPDTCARQVNRVAGWSMAISGLVYAGLWAFASPGLALIGGCGAVAAGIAVTLGYCLNRRASAKAG